MQNDFRRVAAASIPWLSELGETALDWMSERVEPLTIRGGETLFEAGAKPDAVYLVASGSLGAFDGARLIGQVVAGETVGEQGMITGRPRNATVRALRDSQLLRLTRSAFNELTAREPTAVLAMARLALARAATPGTARSRAQGPRTLAILPQHEGLDTLAFAHRLAADIGAFGDCTVIDSTEGGARDGGWFHELEHRFRYVLYVADPRNDEWRDLVKRQADALLYLCEPGANAAPWSEAASSGADTLARPEHLAVWHRAKPRLGAARRWLKLMPQVQLHHIRSFNDVPRLARIILGRSKGLVLSGGGARGFAHLGVIKAIREAGIAVDLVGGTSIGAIIGAGVAADWSNEEMVEVYRRSFVDTNPLSDYTLPMFSLVSGRKVSRLLRDAFGEREIEDLVLPYFCVSANLTAGRAAVHRRGALWQWLRASVAIPGVLPPVFQRGEVLVDGGVINNLPVDVMHDSHRGQVIAVDIGGDHAVDAKVDEFDLPPWWRLLGELFGVRRRPGILSVLLRAGMVNSGAATVAARSVSELVIAPPLADIDLLDWQQFDRVIDIGYQHALRELGGRRDALSEESPRL